MNASLFQRARTERFAQLFDEASGGRRHHSRSRSDDELAAFVALGQQLQDMPLQAAPRTAFRQDLRAQLIAAAERDGIGSTARQDADEQYAAGRRSVSAIPGAPAGSTGRGRARGAIVVGVAAGTLALSGMSVASGEAIPGDALYGVKRSTERAQLALAGSDLSRGQLHLEFARTRAREAHTVRGNEAGMVTALTDMDGDTRHGAKMLVTAASDRHDTTALDAVDRFVSDQKLRVGQMLEAGGGTAREKVTESLTLLAAIEKRSLGTRAALACGVASVGTDQLGPVPGACNTLAAPASYTTTTEQGGAETTAQPGGSTVAPPAAAPDAETSADPKAQETDDGLLGELGRILGSLLS